MSLVDKSTRCSWEKLIGVFKWRWCKSEMYKRQKRRCMEMFLMDDGARCFLGQKCEMCKRR